MPSKHPVVIVGGGLAGLATLCLLRRAGESARLFEASPELGGRGRVTKHAEAELAFGGHALYHGHAAELFDALGIELSGKQVEHRAALGLLEDRAVPLPLSGWQLLTSDAVGLRDKLNAGAMLAHPEAFARARSDQTVKEWLDQSRLPPQARLLVEALARVTTYSSLHELSAEVAKAQIRIGGKGVRYLDGGFGQLARKLEADARASGARIDTGAAVRAVEVADGRVVGVRLASGETVITDRVVLCLAPRQFAKLLPQSPEARVHAAQAVPMRAACLDLVVRGPSPSSTFALGLSTPHYFAVHSEAARLCPDTHTVLHAARYLGPDEKPDAEVTRAELEALVDRVAPGTMSNVDFARFLPSIAVSEWLPTAATNGYAGRPSVRSEIAGVYRAGDWVGAQGMLADAACASARSACHAVLRDSERRAA